MKTAITLLSILMLIFFLLLIASYIIFLYIFGARRRTESEQKKADEQFLSSCPEHYMTGVNRGIEFANKTLHEEIYIKAADNIYLHAAFYPQEGASKTIILSHGYRSEARFNYGAVMEYYKSLGLNLLLIDQRGHGRSEGKYITFGALEGDDIALWADMLYRRFGDEHKIILSGVSMGATSAIRASNSKYAPKTVCGVIFDCGFSSAWEEFAYVMKKDFFVPAFPILHLVSFWCKAIGKFSLRSADATAAAKALKLPVLFIHGDSDLFVPMHNSKKCFGLCPSENKQIFIAKNAGHGMSYFAEKEKCAEYLRRFLTEI